MHVAANDAALQLIKPLQEVCCQHCWLKIFCWS